MTYGEYYYLIKYEMRLVNGVWVATKPRVTIPTRMKRKEALIYYTAKLKKYWISIDVDETTMEVSV